MKTIGQVKTWIAGIADDKKFGGEGTFAFGSALNFRSKRSELTINPKTTKISGSIVTDLPMWMETACNDLYAYGNTGKIYKIDENDSASLEHTAASSTGNGLAYFPEDENLYYAQTASLGKKSDACGSGDYLDNFLESEGGEPTNPKSLSLAAASSQSATRADTASLSVTGDLTLEAYIKPSSLPTTGNEMVLISKWDESGTTQSYKLSLVTVSNDFGDGSDGALTISSNTTQSPTDSACSGTSGTNTLTATNASFANGQVVLIHQTRGTNAGTYQRSKIASYTTGTITLEDNLTFSPNSTGSNKAQIIVVPQHTNITVNSGVTWTAKAWDGSVGGILVFLANGTCDVNGSISTNGKGFIGAQFSPFTNAYGTAGEGTSGAEVVNQNTANGNGGGGGQQGSSGPTGGGGGGGNGSMGTNGATASNGRIGGKGGNTSGSSDLTLMTFGGGGGATVNGGDGQRGGNGGGIVYGYAATIDVDNSTGSITSSGNVGETAMGDVGGGGGGAGGSINIFAQNAALNTNRITASGGSGGSTTGGGFGGAGGTGRVNINYSTSLTGTTTPTLNSVIDSSLSTTDGYGIQLELSSNGTNEETYTQSINNPQDTWTRFSVSWDASISTAYFYQNAVLIGTKVGAFTAIHDNASEFALGCFTNSGSSRESFYNGLMDDVRVWSVLRTSSQILQNTNEVLTGFEASLAAYYVFSDDLTDSQSAGNNDLTANNTPTYSTDVPFSGVTTRLDQDLLNAATGQTYTLTTGIDEGATHRYTFTPTKEPIKSVSLNIDTVGTGNWTIVVHDSLNQQVATVTVLNGDLFTGEYEFVFDSPFRPTLNANYHIHVYSTVTDGQVVTSTISDLTTAFFKSFFQILVDDEYHPIKQFLNFLAIGNERYLAIFEAGNIYNPHRLTLPSGFRIRSLSLWREYLVISTWKGNEITDTDEGRIFFWDGTSDTYVEPLTVPQGGINVSLGSQGTLYLVAGYEGKLFEYTGGDEASYVEDMPEILPGEYAEVSPGAMTMWRGIVYYAATLNTDSESIHQGVYGYGRTKSNYPRSLGFDFPLSIGDTTSSSVRVGSLYARKQKLYIGYQNSNSFGIDVVDPTGDCYATARLELLIADMGSIPTPKLPLIFRADFLPLESGQSFEMEYKINRSDTWKPLLTQDKVDSDEMRGIINERCKELELAVVMNSTTGETPTLLELNLEAEVELEGRRL